MFHSFLSDDSKQDASTTTTHSKLLITLLKEKELLKSSLITIWENTDGCAEQYRYASALYLMPVISQCYSVTIDSGISAPGNGKEVVDRINDIDKRYIYQLMANVQLNGSKKFDYHMHMHTITQNNNVSLHK